MTFEHLVLQAICFGFPTGIANAYGHGLRWGMARHPRPLHLSLATLALFTALVPTEPAHAIPAPPPPVILEPPESDLALSSLQDEWTATCTGPEPDACDVSGRFLRLRDLASEVLLRVPLAERGELLEATLDGTPLQRRGTALVIPPGPSPVTIAVQYRIPIWSQRRHHSMIISGLQMRHLVLFQGRESDTFELWVAEAKNRPTNGYTCMVVPAPRGGLDATTMTGDKPRARGLSDVDVGVDVEPSRARLVTFRRDADTFRFGGPLVGLGSSLGDDAEFRMRLGLEGGIGETFIVGLAFDTDYDDEHVLAPQLEVSTPGIVFLPITLGAGLGLPIDLERGDVGARIILSTQIAIFGFAATFDIWPERRDGLDTTLMFTISL